MTVPEHFDPGEKSVESASHSEEVESPFPELDHKKAQLDQARPLLPEAVAKLKEFFDIEWTHHSTAIEGNTMTLRETAVVLKHGITIGGKSLKEHLELIDHKKAIDFIETLASVRRQIEETDILKVHALVTEGLDYALPGKYRPIQVRIGGSEHLPPPPEEVPRRMKELVQWLARTEVPDFHPLNVAATAHIALASIHPFVDGNGRVARLLQNLLLMRRGFPPAIIRFDDRMDYYEALRRADAGQGDGAFVRLLASAVNLSLDTYLEAVQ